MGRTGAEVGRKERRMRLNDLISRQEAINKILEYFIEYHGGAFREDDQRALIEVFEKMPTVDAEPVRHGRWVEEVTDDGKGFPRTEYTCPFCQYKTRADTNYCPECGARLSEDGITK